MLECRGVAARFGEVVALDHIDLTVGPSEVLGIIGPNGSGKSTLVNMLSGLYRPVAGELLWRGQRVTNLQPQDLRRHGIVRTFQNLRLLDHATVAENVLLGMYTTLTPRSGLRAFGQALLPPPRSRRTLADARRTIDCTLTRFGLAAHAGELAGGLSFGLLKRVELARAVVSEPALLLLDEPAAGIGHEDVEDLFDFVCSEVTKRGGAVVFIEHRLDLVRQVCTRLAVLDAGRKIADGSIEAVLADQEVSRAYLGA